MKTHKNCWWWNHCMNHYEFPPDKCPDYIYDQEKDSERIEDGTDSRGASSTPLVEPEK